MVVHQYTKMDDSSQPYLRIKQEETFLGFYVLTRTNQLKALLITQDICKILVSCGKRKMRRTDGDTRGK